MFARNQQIIDDLLEKLKKSNTSFEALKEEKQKKMSFLICQKCHKDIRENAIEEIKVDLEA